MTDRERLRCLIRDRAVVRGPAMSPGLRPHHRVDLHRVTLHHAAAPLVGRVLLDLTADWDYAAVGGLTLGADVVATAMLHAAAARGRRLDAFVVRGTANLSHQIEGPDVAGRRVLAVEDIASTGRSVLAAVAALEEADAEVVGVAVLVDRGAADAVRHAGLDYRAAYSLRDLGLA